MKATLHRIKLFLQASLHRLWERIRYILSRKMHIIHSPYKRSHGKTQIFALSYVTLSIFFLGIVASTGGMITFLQTHESRQNSLREARILEATYLEELQSFVLSANELKIQQNLFQTQINDLFFFLGNYQKEALWPPGKNDIGPPLKQEALSALFGDDNTQTATEILNELKKYQGHTQILYTHLTNTEQYLTLRKKLAITIPNGWPVEKNIGYKTSPFGPRFSPFSENMEFHYGVDIAAPIGVKVIAASAGEVEVSEYRKGYGQVVIIRHAFGYKSLYSHNRTNLVRPTQIVKKGEPIAEVGNTGRSTGPHLHFEIRIGNKPIDPWPYMVRSF